MKKNGFTLLEILIAFVLFTLGVVVIAGLFGSGLLSSSDAENTIIAMNLAQRKMEEIRNLSFAEIAPEAKADVDIDVDGDEVNDFPGIQWQVEVEDPQGDPTADDLKRVIVTVYWTFKGDEIGVPLQTYISKN